MRDGDSDSVTREEFSMKSQNFVACSVIWLLLISGGVLSAQEPDCSVVERQFVVGPTDSFFGGSVAISHSERGAVCLIGAPAENTEGPGAGAVYVYRFHQETASWMRESRIPPVLTGETGFGAALSVRGDVAVIGHGEAGGGKGGAYIYRYDEEKQTWRQEQILTPDGLPDGTQFGFSVAMAETGKVAVVGANGENRAYVFRDNGLHQWNHEAILSPQDGEGWFGYDVSISENRILVMASDPGGPQAAYVYIDNATWKLEQKLVVANQALAYGVGVISGDTILFGGATVDNNSGAAFVWCHQDGAWEPRYSIFPPTTGGGGLFGGSIDLQGSEALITEQKAEGHGTAYAYVLACDGVRSWAELNASDPEPGDNFGESVAVAPGLAVVGSEAEAAYFFAGIDDCNTNSQLDVCDVGNGHSADNNGNGIPDECECPGETGRETLIAKCRRTQSGKVIPKAVLAGGSPGEQVIFTLDGKCPRERTIRDNGKCRVKWKGCNGRIDCGQHTVAVTLACGTELEKTVECACP